MSDFITWRCEDCGLSSFGNYTDKQECFEALRWHINNDCECFKLNDFDEFSNYWGE